MFLHPLYEIAAEASDRSVREKVLEEAFTESAAVVQAPLDAMRGVAKFDAARAAEAVEVGLSNHPSGSFVGFLFSWSPRGLPRSS